MLRFPAMNGLQNVDETEESKENKDEEASMMSDLNENGNGNEFQHDIAMMDAQIANLSSICSNIQSNYYDLNQKLDDSHDLQIPQKMRMNQSKENRNNDDT